MVATLVHEQVQLKMMIVQSWRSVILLAVLLERLGVDYEFFERSKRFNPLGRLSLRSSGAYHDLS